MLNKKIPKYIFCFAGAYFMLSNPQAIMLYVKNRLIICYNSVIPSLYVFMVFANYVAQRDMMPLFSVPFMWYSNLMKIQDKEYSGYLLLSLIGGFAVGANMLKKLSDKGYNKNAIKAIAPSMINNSFSFCVFAVGIGYLENYRVGLMLFVSLTLASLITSFILSFIYQYNIVSFTENCNESEISFVKSINSAVQSILAICGFVVIFYVVCEVLSLYTLNNDFLSILIGICLEVTSGCVKIVEISGKNSLFLCFCLSFVPVSTLCQVYYFTDDIDIVKTLLTSRIIHTPVSLIIFSVLTQLFPVAASVANNNSIVVQGCRNTMEISATLFMITVVFLIIFDRNKLFTKQDL